MFFDIFDFNYNILLMCSVTFLSKTLKSVKTKKKNKKLTLTSLKVEQDTPKIYVQVRILGENTL